MRVLTTTAAVLALGLVSVAPANAQSLDGVYRGTIRTTEDITLDSGRSDRCPPIGTVGKSEFRVAGSTITVITPAGLFSGTVSNDGRFSIVTAVRGASYSGARSREWKGTITGSRIEGTHQLQAAGFICRDVFSAKK